MTVGLTLCCRAVVAGATCLTNYVRASVVGVGWQEACRSMTVAAFRVSNRVCAKLGRIGARYSFIRGVRFTNGYNAGMAS